MARRGKKQDTLKASAYWKKPRVDMRGARGKASGRMGAVPTPPTWRASSRQVCGLWPFSAGAGVPSVGVPVGRHVDSGRSQAVCFDPITWFQRGIISNPSMFVLGLPGLGKSSLVRHLVMGMAGYGINTMVLGDLKPDYVDLVRALGGQVLEVGRGRGRLNPLDTGLMTEAARHADPAVRDKILSDARGRQSNMLTALIQLTRGSLPDVRENNVLDAALRVLSEGETTPTLPDVLRLVKEGPEPLRVAAIDRGNTDRYRELTEELEATLTAIIRGYGGVFASDTSAPMSMDRPVVFDISAIGENDETLAAAVLLACWSYGFGNISTANMLADAGLMPRRNYFIVMDELWRVLQAGEGMVDRINHLTRLNRQWGVGQAMITHTPSDLEALPSEADRAKARGFIDRSGVVLCGGLPRGDIDMLRKTQLRLTKAEQETIESWSDLGGWDQASGATAAAPGRGHFLLKAGQRPGVPFECILTNVELALNDTNKRWQMGGVKVKETSDVLAG